ncbi:polysaccharide deacetylase domain containing protein [Calothrix sp. NIES-4101]|nr:polysaccharide deacetylase domain containing protein [Calothrix sp. NIES-4101]
MPTIIIVLITITLLTFYVLDKLAKTAKIQLFGEYFLKVNTKEMVVALTYDDGPHPPYTNQLINLLNRLEAKATFFTVGKNVEEHPETVMMLVESGHEVGNHSYSHKELIWKKPAFVSAEINKTDELLRRLGVRNEILFRAPFGFKRFTLPYILNRMHKKHILWNLDPKDYQENNPELIANRVFENVTPGAIILLHDGGGDRTATIAATEIIITKLQAQGYKFLTVSQMLAQRNNTN